MSFNLASGNYVEAPTNSAMNVAAGSWAAWINTTQTTANVNFLSRADSPNSTNGVYFTFSGAASSWALNTKGAGGGGTSVGATTHINDGNWHHICGTFLESGGTGFVYTDGSQENSAANGAFTFNNNPFRMGRSVDTFWAAYVGLMADVGYWSAQLSLAEVKALARGVSPHRIRPGSLVLYCPLRTLF